MAAGEQLRVGVVVDETRRSPLARDGHGRDRAAGLLRGDRAHQRAGGRSVGGAGATRSTGRTSAWTGASSGATTTPSRECPSAGLASRSDEIASCDLDVVLCLAPDAAPGELAGHARLGAWALYAGGLRGGAGEAQLFWQMYDADFVAPITLRATTPTDGERTIYCSVVQSDHVSLHRSRCGAARRAAHLPARRLRALHDGLKPVAFEEPSTPDPGRPRPTNAMMARLAVARRERGPAQARERLAAREAVVHRLPAGLRAAHADHASSRPVLRGPVPLPARRPPLRLLRGLRRELRARRHLLPRDRRGWTALLAAARPPAGLPPLVSLRVRGGRRRLHAPRDRRAPDGRALPSSAVPGRVDARAGPPEGRQGDGRHAAAPRGQVVAVRRARPRRRPPDRRALPVLLRLAARRVGAASPESDRLGRSLGPPSRTDLLAERCT